MARWCSAGSAVAGCGMGVAPPQRVVEDHATIGQGRRGAELRRLAQQAGRRTARRQGGIAGRQPTPMLGQRGPQTGVDIALGGRHPLRLGDQLTQPVDQGAGPVVRIFEAVDALLDAQTEGADIGDQRHQADLPGFGQGQAVGLRPN